MLGPLFKIYLRRDAGNYYTVNAAGAVVLTTIKTPLKNDPDGWAETEAANVRSFRFVALERQYANAYRFPLDGAQILRYVDYTQGVNGVCQVEIEQRNDLDGLYTPYFIGDVDFSTEAVDEESFYVAPIKELGLAGILRAKMDVDIEIPIDGPEVVQTKVESFTINGTASWITAYPTPYIPATAAPWVFYAFNQQDTVGYPITVINSNYGSGAGTGAPEYVFSANQNLYGVSLQGRVRFTVTNLTGSNPLPDTDIDFRPLVRYGIGGGMSANYIFGVYTAGPNDTITFDIDLADFPPVDMVQGDTITIIVAADGGSQQPPTGTPPPPPSAFDLSWASGDTLTVNYKFDGPDFTFAGLRPSELFARIINKHTGGEYTGQSDFLSDATATYAEGLDNIPYQTIFTSGNAIRGLPAPTIKTTLGKFFDTCNSLWSVGFSIEDEIARIEKKARYFNQSNVIASFSDPKSVSVRKAADYLFKKITVGYSTQATEKVNGRDEYNTTTVFETPLIRPDKELNLVSPAIASMYSIFTVYTEYVTRTTSDGPKDNDTFLLEIEDTAVSGIYPARKWTGSTVTGVLVGDDALNLGLTPGRCIRRNGPYIRIGLYELDNEEVIFQLNERNPELQSDLASGLIIEKENIPVSDLGAPLALPYVLVAVVNSPRNIVNTTSAQQGVIEVFYRGAMRRGFPVKVGCKSATLGEYEITLLLSPDNDLTELF